MGSFKEWGMEKHPIHPDHEEMLERYAAIHQYGGNTVKGRAEAEKDAHHQYSKEMALKNAQHHYAHFQAARALGEKDIADLHLKRYADSLKVAGHTIYDAPPDVRNYAPEKKTGYRYMSHDMDGLFHKEEDKKKE